MFERDEQSNQGVELWDASVNTSGGRRELHKTCTNPEFIHKFVSKNDDQLPNKIGFLVQFVCRIYAV